MALGDLLAKIGRGDRLTPQEQNLIRLMGNQMESNNSYILGLQNGRSSVAADDISANRLYVGREVFSGLAARFVCSLSVANGTYVDSTNWTTDYADAGFYTSGTNIYIPETGRYVVTFQVSWDNALSTTGYRDSGAQKNGSPDRPQGNNNAVPVAYTYVRAYDEVEYTKGDAVKFTHYHNGGATLTLDMWVVFRKIR